MVYAAHDAELDRPVAIKMVTGQKGDETARKRFQREAKAAARIRHPNVCQLYDIGEEEGELFLAMELLEGESLATRLERGPLPVPEAIRLGLDVLSALGALHEQRIVHRDLKPSNIFLTPHGAKLLDFGLARDTSVNLATQEATSVLLRPDPWLESLRSRPRFEALVERSRQVYASARAEFMGAGGDRLLGSSTPSAG